MDDVDSAIESINPYKYREKFGLNAGYIYAEAMDLLPSLSNKRFVEFLVWILSLNKI